MDFRRYSREKMIFCSYSQLFGLVKVFLLVGFLIISSSCSRIPKIIILHDSLSAEEHNDLGIVYEQEGKLDLALREYKKALAKEENYVKARVNLGNVLFKKREYNRAREEYSRSISLDPSNPDPLNNMAWIYIIEKENLEEAKLLAEKALELDQANGYIYRDTLGMIAFLTGRLQEALCLIEKSIEETPPSEVSRLEEEYEHLEAIYRTAGLYDKAEKAVYHLNALRKDRYGKPVTLPPHP